MPNAVHHLKSWPTSFDGMWSGEQPFDVRHDDRAFTRGDVLVLQEWDQATGRYTGRELIAKVGRVWTDWHLVGLRGGDVDPAGVVVMGLRVVSHRAHPGQPHTVRPEALL